MEIAITPTHDIDYSPTGFCTTQGTPALMQALTTRLRLLNEEYLYDPTQGIDYIHLMSSNNIDYFTRAIDFEIKKDPRVSFTEMQHDFTHGILNLTIKVAS